MSPDSFRTQIEALTAQLAGRPLDAALGDWLNREHGPGSEIDLLMPIEGDARLDGHPAGWVVYGPGTAHRPTV